jgi:hypothetical protein
MTEEWQLDLKVTGKGEKVLHTSSEGLGTGGTILDRQRELDKLNMKEAMDQFRYFGTLRALISWFPIVITLSVLGFVWSEMETYSIAQNGLLIVALAAVFVVIFFAQVYLQKLQFRSRLVFEILQRRYLGSETEAQQVSLSGAFYHQICKAIPGTLKGGTEFTAQRGYPQTRRVDGASLWLIVFMVIVWVTAVVVVVMRSQASERAQVADIECEVTQVDFDAGSLTARCRSVRQRESEGEEGKDGD